MFGKLKEKLKSWISRTKEESEEVVEEVKVKKSKKETAKEISPKRGVTSKKKAEKEPSKTKKEKKSAKKKIEKPISESSIESVVEEPLKQTSTKEEIVATKKSFFSRFRRSLSQEKFNELFEELELVLLQNNVAFEAVDAIRASLQSQLVGESASVDISEALRKAILELLVDPPKLPDEIKKARDSKEPFIILFCGINGSGKTTTIAKVAYALKQQGFSVCLAAADTFRAASIEQIAEHANRLNVPLIKKEYGSDPAAVSYDAVAYAKKHNTDVVLIDTAGRMQNKDSLMREIEKISRVAKPHMKIFLGESITGNDATQQAKAFNETIGLSGIILSKADVDEKGGTAISVSYVTKKPILFLGTGQGYDNLEVFDKKKLLEKLGL